MFVFEQLFLVYNTSYNIQCTNPLPAEFFYLNHPPPLPTWSCVSLPRPMHNFKWMNITHVCLIWYQIFTIILLIEHQFILRKLVFDNNKKVTCVGYRMWFAIVNINLYPDSYSFGRVRCGLRSWLHGPDCTDLHEPFTRGVPRAKEQSNVSTEQSLTDCLQFPMVLTWYVRGVFKIYQRSENAYRPFVCEMLLI